MNNPGDTMKKTTLTILIILTLTLTACGSASNTPRAVSSQSSDSSAPELPIASKLAVGSFKLEGTDTAITPKEASELLPLWQVYQQLSTSDTAAQEEISALTDQIQETLTPDQMKAINDLTLTQQEVFAFMQEQGIAEQSGRTFTQGNGSNNSNNQRGNGSFNPRGGNFFGPGGGPDGGFGGGQNLNPQQIATAQARRSQNGGGNFRFNRTPTALIDALIKMLQAKANS